MRANINLDTEAYEFATAYANARGLPLGVAVSELIKRAEQTPEPASGLLVRNKRGLLVRARRTGRAMITSKMAKALSEDDLA